MEVFAVNPIYHPTYREAFYAEQWNRCVFCGSVASYSAGVTRHAVCHHCGGKWSITFATMMTAGNVSVDKHPNMSPMEQMVAEIEKKDLSDRRRGHII